MAVLLAGMWFAGTFALTIFVPTRSSLYALLPSIAPALVAGFLLQQLWDASSHEARPGCGARGRGSGSSPLFLMPVYRS